MNRIHYGVQLFDDIHTYLPDILYNPSRFNNVQDLLDYIGSSARNITPYTQGLNEYRNNTRQVTNTPVENTINESSNINTRERVRARIRTIPISSSLYSVDIPLSTNMDDITNNIFNQILNPQILRNFLDQNVTIRPTQQEIEHATTIQTIRESTDDMCAICQEDLEESDEVRKINHCRHIFHKDCVDEWFNRNVHCPTCRFDIREIPENQ